MLVTIMQTYSPRPPGTRCLCNPALLLKVTCEFAKLLVWLAFGVSLIHCLRRPWQVEGFRRCGNYIPFGCRLMSCEVSSDVRTFTTPWLLFDAVAQVTEIHVHRDVSGVVWSTRLCELWRMQYALISWPNGRTYRDQFADVMEGPSDRPGVFQVVSFPRVSPAKRTY